MDKKYVMITGVAGLLGSRLADWVLKNTEYDVIGIDDLSGGYENNIPKGVKLFSFDLSVPENELLDIETSVLHAHGSITNYITLEGVFDRFKPEYVFHFAAYAAEGLSPFIRCYNYQNNLVATAHIVNLCIKNDVKRLVFTSSMAVYGDQEAPFHEDMLPQPIDPYGVAKFSCEQDIRIAGEQHGLDWCIIRPHNVYGINQNIWDRYRNVLGIWMYQYKCGDPITIFGDGEQTRAFSFIDDSLEPLWKSAVIQEASKEIINLGGVYETSIKDAAEILCEVIGDPDIEVVHLEARHEVKHAHSTYQKSIDILGFEHKTDLREGLQQMWDWAKIQPMRKQFVWSEYELDKGLYSFWR